MSIKVGDTIPEAMLAKMSATGPEPIASKVYFAGRKIALFAVPGAFTPTCSAYHLPGFVEHAQALRDAGIDAIACMSVNDVFVMDAWGKSANADSIDMLADGNAEFSTALGLQADASAYGMGMRSRRFALIADNGVVTHIMVDAPGEFRVSSAESVLEALA